MSEIVELEPFKKGDTPTFRFNFTNPYVDFDWSVVTLDCAMTSVQAPASNDGAAAVRLDQSLQVTTGGAYYEFTLTILESKALSVNAKYKVEAQLKQGGTSVATPVTAQVKVLQDYVV